MRRTMWLTRRAILLHLTVLVVVPVFFALCDWQVHRALSGNELSWCYVFEWPFFAGYAVFLWWKLVHEDPSPEGATDDRSTTREAAPNEPAARRNLAEDPGASPPAAGSVAAPAGSVAAPAGSVVAPAGSTYRCADDLDDRAPAPGAEPAPSTDDADTSDEELAAYNRYLAELNASNVRKTW